MRGSAIVSVVTATATILAALPQQRSQFTVAVDVVRVDVVVTDANGNFVSNLEASDFVLFEDDTRRELTDIQLVELSTGAVRSLLREGGGSESSSRHRAPGDLGALIFFLDFPGLYFQNKARFADGLLDLLEDIDDIAVPHAVYFADLNGHLRELVPLTRDVGRLRDAAQQVRDLPLVQTRDDLLAFLESDMGGLTRWSQSRERQRALDTFRLLTELAGSLVARPGRKAVVWVSTGIDLAAYDTVARGRQSDSREGFRFYSVDETRSTAQELLHDAANTANVSIYSVDPSALHEFYSLSTSTRAGSVADARGNSLRDASSTTGGIAFIGWSELERVLQRIEADASAFYLLSYESSRVQQGDDYHAIRVEVSRPGVEVRARRGYGRMSTDDRRRQMVRGALQFPGIVSGFEVAADGIRAANEAGNELLVVAVRAEDAPGSDAVNPGATQPLHVYAIARKTDGSVAAHFEGITAFSTTDQELRGSYLAPRTAETGHRVASQEIRWELAPGDYKVNIALLEPDSETVGATAFDTTIAEFGEEWGASDPAVLVEGSDGALSVAVKGIVFSDQRPIVYVEVYNGQEPKVTLAVSRASGSGSQAESAAPEGQEGVTVTLDSDGSIHRGSARVPVLAPGIYEVRIVIEDGPIEAVRTTALPLEVRARR